MNTKILVGNVRERINDIADESVQCVVTSPPYFGLRDYGTGQWIGGDAECDHKKVSDVATAVATSTLDGGKKTTGHQQEGFGKTCGKCGAVRHDTQIGLESTLAAYIAAMVDVFRGVRRVLRDDGVVWLNIGDSYAGGAGGSLGRNDAGRNFTGGGGNKEGSGNPGNQGTKRSDSGLKAKDLMMVPARLAIALQDDGWYLRSDVIWAKPNPMPESVTDRPSSAHEHIFLLTKSAKYYYDACAVREIAVTDHKPGRKVKETDHYGAGNGGNTGLTGFLGKYHGDNAPTDRNLRNVWQIATKGFPGAHFATFPPDIPRRCIKAGSKPGDTVLDPFLGSGTTLLVADELGRNGIGIELNPVYAEMARNRIAGASPMFATVDVS